MSDATIHQNGKVYKYKDTFTKPLVENQKKNRRKRTCLRCDKSFVSASVGNRLCSSCRVTNTQKIDMSVFGAML